ncbi:MAG TPA: transglycosylase SLT domain-containing protein [Burkholderiaceae bacterium]|nr:transglycosylase SLT domain-containing protein [Burkholderiaceae bacterium]
MMVFDSVTAPFLRARWLPCAAIFALAQVSVYAADSTMSAAEQSAGSSTAGANSPTAAPVPVTGAITLLGAMSAQTAPAQFAAVAPSRVNATDSASAAAISAMTNADASAAPPTFGSAILPLGGVTATPKPAADGSKPTSDQSGASAPAPGASSADTTGPASQSSPLVTSDDKDLWNRIRRGFKMPDLDTKRTQATTRWYAAQPDYMARMTTRASMYLYHIVEEIEKRGMPTELALLPFVESAMQPEAISVAQAAGLWQFIPSTGKIYSLEQNLWHDERLGVIESTRAALDYLQNLYAEFGDWQLALAAYNCGEAGVERALARARAAHRSLAYKDLRLPRETQYYFPKLQAIKNIVADPQRFGIELPDIRNEPYFVAMNKTRDMDVATAARLADMPIEEFRALNPAFNRPLILGASSPTILIPADRVDTFEANLAAFDATGQPLASWTAYTLQQGDVLAKVAERVGLTEAQLREANRIPPRYRPAVGSTILIPRDETMSDDVSAGFVSASFALVPESANLRQVTYRVRRGDTLASVARRWHVQADDIVAWNQLHSMSLFAGQRLNLTVARPTVASSHKVNKAVVPAVSTSTRAAAHAPAASATASRM